MIISPLVGKNKDELRAELLMAARLKPDCLEWRADGFQFSSPRHISAVAITEELSQISTAMGTQFMVTLRQNIFDLSDLFFNHCDIIDIDFGDLMRENQSLIPLFQDFANSKLLVISFHDFKYKSFNVKHYTELIESCKNLIPNAIIKIAFTPISLLDALKFLEFVRNTDIKIIAVPMGKHGAGFRLIAREYNSIAEYAYLIESNAEGQPSLEMLNLLIK